MFARVTLALLAISLVSVTPPAAAQAPVSIQDRPFVFSVSTRGDDKPKATVHLDTAFGERPFDLVEADRPEQRIGLQAYLGHRLTLLARAGVATGDDTPDTSQQGELLFSVFHAPAQQANVAVGMGVRHESAGVNVVLVRAAAGRNFSAWRVDGNALFEKPLSAGRDSVDLITTVGIARRVLPSLYLGLEMIGEDLEGFWEAEEAEGGARLLAGPSIRVAPPSARWQFGVAGGPIVHATRTASTSDATRALRTSNARNGFAVRASLSVGF